MQIFSVNWWVNMFINTFVTIIFIYLIKAAFNKINVPVVSDMVESV